MEETTKPAKPSIYNSTVDPEKKITKEMPCAISRSGYQPLTKNNCEIRFNLTFEQQTFVDEVAKKYDLQFWAALEMVWTDAFSILVQQQQIKGTYSDLPAITTRSKVFG